MPLEPSEMNPAMSPDMGAPAQGFDIPAGEHDHEGAMAKADLYKLANYSLKLFKQMDDGDQLESWVQAKITKAADYIASVYHYLQYEMKFSEYGHHLDNSDTLSEGQKMKIKELLSEARSKMKELKKEQADKAKKVEEGILSGGERPCTECGGTGMVYEEPKPIPAHVKGKVEKYKRLTKATHAAHKRLDANNNGIPDDEELGEETSSTGGTITRGKGFTRHSHNPDRFSDEPHGEPAGKAKSQSAADKAGDKAADKAEEKQGKDWEKRFGKGSVTRVKDGKKVDEALKGKQKKLDVDKDGDIEGDDLADLRAGKKVDESKPSAGLSKKEKSAVVKKAKAGGDIGKPGKNFDKVAAKAGGGEKGKKIAAAAMWKNIKEEVAYLEEKKAATKADKDYDGDGKIESGKDEHAGSVDKAIKAAKAKETVKESVVESSELSRMQEQLGRLNRNESIQVTESAEVAQLRKLTKLLG